MVHWLTTVTTDSNLIAQLCSDHAYCLVCLAQGSLGLSALSQNASQALGLLYIWPGYSVTIGEFAALSTFFLNAICRINSFIIHNVRLHWTFKIKMVTANFKLSMQQDAITMLKSK